MTKLYLIQHGEAKPKDEDASKPLTEHGAAVVEAMAAWASRAAVTVSEIRHSGKLRAEQTAEILGRHLAPERGVLAAAGLGPNDDVEPLTRELASRDEPLMVVGHLPFLDRLASRLVAGDPAAGAVQFTNAGIVCLGREADSWSLMWAVTPELVAHGSA